MLQIVDVVLISLQRVELLRAARVVLLPLAERNWDGIAVLESPLAELRVVVFQLVYRGVFKKLLEVGLVLVSRNSFRTTRGSHASFVEQMRAHLFRHELVYEFLDLLLVSRRFFVFRHCYFSFFCFYV